ncbi:hypothetical protein NYE48_12010 [Paenibacillus sp. FSL M7-1455]|uniref:hypothetical protein n=1 Tax=Paenibacillus sp. FSL M7-1455 TaxID=2975316 RepID=UPI0030F52644
MGASNPKAIKKNPRRSADFWRFTPTEEGRIFLELHGPHVFAIDPKDVSVRIALPFGVDDHVLLPQSSSASSEQADEQNGSDKATMAENV